MYFYFFFSCFSSTKFYKHVRLDVWPLNGEGWQGLNVMDLDPGGLKMKLDGLTRAADRAL